MSSGDDINSWEMEKNILIGLASNPAVSFHFNLSLPSGQRVDQTYANNKLRMTSQEYALMWKPLFFQKTTFYVKSGSIYKIFDKTKLIKPD